MEGNIDKTMDSTGKAKISWKNYVVGRFLEK